jgi:hypothetical protein
VIRRRKRRPERAAVAMSPDMPRPVTIPHRGEDDEEHRAPTRPFACAPSDRPVEWKAIPKNQLGRQLETHRAARLGAACACCCACPRRGFYGHVREELEKASSEARAARGAVRLRGTRKTRPSEAECETCGFSFQAPYFGRAWPRRPISASLSTGL